MKEMKGKNWIGDGGGHFSHLGAKMSAHFAFDWLECLPFSHLHFHQPAASCVRTVMPVAWRPHRDVFSKSFVSIYSFSISIRQLWFVRWRWQVNHFRLVGYRGIGKFCVYRWTWALGHCEYEKLWHVKWNTSREPHWYWPLHSFIWPHNEQWTVNIECRDGMKKVN